MDILSKYQEYATEGTDAPSKYHRFCSAAVLGCLMGRRLWYKQGHNIIFPHLWVCLLGRSTWMKKSTAINIAERVIAKMNEEAILTTKLSLEKLYAVVSKSNWGLLCYRELQILLAMMGRDFNAELKSTLTDWYDAPYMAKYSSMGMGETEIVVRRPSVTILAGSTMEWLLEAAKTKDIAGGFYPRWLFAHSENSDVADKPRPGAASEVKLNAILYTIKNEILAAYQYETFDNGDDERRGRMDFTKEGGTEYDKIYSSWKKEYGDHPVIGSFAGRGLTHLIKLSMISAMGRKRSQVMGPDDVRYAYDIVMSSMNDIREITTYEMADTKTDQSMLKLRKYLRLLGPAGATRRTLLREGPIRTPDYLDKLLEALRQAGYVTILPGKRKDTGIFQSLETYIPTVAQPMTVATVEAEPSQVSHEVSRQSKSFIEAPNGL